MTTESLSVLVASFLVVGALGSALSSSDPQWWRWWERLDPEPETPGEWLVGHSYQVDDEVTYDGARYLVLQAHTSQPDWPPNAVPALYQAIVEED